MHELGLSSIKALPHAVLVDTLQQLCLAARTSDATTLPAFLAKQLRASAMVPELEKFVDAVCEVRSAQRLHTEHCMRALGYTSMHLYTIGVGRNVHGRTYSQPRAPPQTWRQWVVFIIVTCIGIGQSHLWQRRWCSGKVLPSAATLP